MSKIPEWLPVAIVPVSEFADLHRRFDDIGNDKVRQEAFLEAVRTEVWEIIAKAIPNKA